MRTCKACKDQFDPALKATKVGEHGYCPECADELYRGIIPTGRAKIFFPGRGSPGEPSEFDASPWQENVIRIMEGD